MAVRAVPQDLGTLSSFTVAMLDLGHGCLDMFRVGERYRSLYFMVRVCAPHRPGETHHHFIVSEVDGTHGPGPSIEEEPEP